MEDNSAITGVAVIQVIRDGEVIHEEETSNIVTTAGDQYYAKKAIVGVSPAGAAAPTAASGMKLGTGTTAAAKSGAGGALVTYISGSNNPFDSGLPTAESVGGDTGWTATYKTTWAAGDVTNAAITEAVIVNDAATDLTSSAANTYARITFSAVNKTVDDSLVITWKHKFLGS